MMVKEVKPKKLMCLTLCRCFKALPTSFIWCDSGIFKSGNVWELNPLGALFKPPDGFEDHGQHQLCKHSRNQLDKAIECQGLLSKEKLRCPVLLVGTR